MNRLACPVETASDLAFDAVVILHCTQRARRNGNKVPRRFRVGKLENPQLVVTHAPGAQRISIKRAGPVNESETPTVLSLVSNHE